MLTLFSFDLIITFDTLILEVLIIEDFQKLTVSLEETLMLKNVIVFTFKGQLDAFSENNLRLCY